MHHIQLALMLANQCAVAEHQLALHLIFVEIKLNLFVILVVLLPVLSPINAKMRVQPPVTHAEHFLAVILRFVLMLLHRLVVSYATLTVFSPISVLKIHVKLVVG